MCKRKKCNLSTSRAAGWSDNHKNVTKRLAAICMQIGFARFTQRSCGEGEGLWGVTGQRATMATVTMLCRAWHYHHHRNSTIRRLLMRTSAGNIDCFDRIGRMDTSEWVSMDWENMEGIKIKCVDHFLSGHLVVYFTLVYYIIKKKKSVKSFNMQVWKK